MLSQVWEWFDRQINNPTVARYVAGSVEDTRQAVDRMIDPTFRS